MSDDTLERAFTAFTRLVELTDDERDAVLREVERDDPAVACEVRSLLGHHQPTDGFLDPSRLRRGFEAIGLEPLRPGMKLRGYTVLERLGSGGSSVVYLAEQDRPRRRVALKVLGTVQSGPALVRRLEREADLLGRLAHPGIAQIYEAGVEDLGDGDRAFLALELVEGLPIDRYAESRGLSDGARVGLMIDVGEAVRHAHLAGVVHLDLKPANILVKPGGAVKIVDFGVGRDLTRTVDDGSLGVTLSYAAPEQLDPDGSPDMRADVFSLGVVLYQLLTGQRPIETGDLVPTRAIGVLTGTPRPSVRAVRPELSADLDGVLARAMEIDADERYQSMSEFVEDLRRFLDDRPVSARQDSAIDTLRRTVRRGRRVLAASGVVAVLLAVAATVAIRSAIKSDALARAEQAAKTEAQGLAKLAADEAVRLNRANYRTAIGYADAALLAGDGARARRALEACDPVLRDWEWDALLTQTDLSSLSLPTVAPGGTTASISPAGDLVLVASYSGESVLIGLTPPRIIGRADMGAPVSTLSVTHDGRVVTASFDGSAAVRDLETLEPLAEIPGGPRLIVKAAPADSRLLRVVFDRVSIYDLDRPDAPPREFDVPGRFTCAAWRRDGGAVALGTYDGEVLSLDLETERVRRCAGRQADSIRDIAYSGSGSAIASAANDGTLRVWDLETDRTRFIARPTDNKLVALCWADHDRMIYTGGTRRTIYGLDAETGITRKRLIGHANTVIAVFEIGPGTLLSLAPDGAARVWETAAPETASRLMRHGALTKRLLSLPGRLLAGFGDGTIAAIDPASGIPTTVATLGAPLAGMEPWEPGVVLAATEDGAIHRIPLHGPAERVAQLAIGPVTAFGVERDASLGFLGSVEGKTVSVDLENASAGSRIASGAWSVGSPIRAIATLHGAAFVATDAGELVRLDPAGGLDRARLSALPLWSVIADPSRDRVLVAGEEGDIHVIDPVTMQTVAMITGDRQALFSLAFNPDGTRLLAGSWDNSVRVHDAETHEQMLTLRGHRFAVFTLAFDPDSDRLYSGCNGGEVMEWFRPARRFPAPP